jgi:sulfotransferase family protein
LSRWLVIAGIVTLLLIAPLVYLEWYLRWERQETSGMAYYGKPLAERRALKRRIRRLSLPVKPLVWLLALVNRKRSTMPVFEYQGVYGPPKVSSREVFARATGYEPTPEDVFVVTQMRCGTTWMQQLVFQIVTRGQGDLSDHGYGHLYAACPWIDAINSVSMEKAPLVGEKPTRIIKSHLPTTLCPYSPDAKYIYVTRHPVSCFASIVDYNRSLLGPLTPRVDELADWFCSDRMYWRPWPEHVTGWWQWAQTHKNVLFVHYEDMTADLSAVRDRVAGFLGYTLTNTEKQLVSDKCSFRYMRDHEECFEMSPPTMYSVAGGRFLASGKASRDEDVTPAIRLRILDYCRKALTGTGYPAGRFYPELAPRQTSG